MNAPSGWAVLLDLDGCLIDGATTTRTTLAAVASCATGHRILPTALPADALHRPRTDVLAGLGVSDPDEACGRWWQGALAAAPPAEPFPGLLAALHQLHSTGAALGIVTVQDRLPARLLIPPALAALVGVVVTRQDARPKPAPDGLHTALDQLGVTPRGQSWWATVPAT